MSDPRWFRSLYWRIAVGFVAFLAVMLAVQAGLFFLLVSRRIERLPSGTAAEFSRLTAADLATELGRDPSFDIAAFAARSDERRAPPFSIVMRDGRMASTPGLAPPPPGFLRSLRRRMETDPPDQILEPPVSGHGAHDEPGGGGPGIAPIVVSGRVVGLVLVSPRRPFSVVVHEFGPMMVVVAVVLLGVGTTLVSLVVFGPASRRLDALALAARRLGAGDLDARAPATGGDEVAAVAHAFNQMAAELSARAGELDAADRARRQLLADV